MKKIWKYAFGATAFAAGGITAVCGAANTMFARTLRRGKKPLTEMNLDPENHNFEEMQKEGKAWAAAHKGQCSRLEITVLGIGLVGYYYDQGAAKSVILVHGFAGHYLDRLCNAPLYFDSGYNVLAVDCRGHGESGGAYRTMGYLDGHDVVCWAKELVEKKGQELIVLDGVSMGSATVLTASGDEELPEQVCGIVADCGFTSIHNVFEHQAKQFMKVPTFPFLNIVEWLCKKKARISTTENSPLECVKRSQTPTLFIHGVEDDYVPYEMGVQLNNACGALKKLLTVKGAGHAQSCKVAPELYEETIRQFLETLEL